MKPAYDVRAWREHGWWLARIVAATDGASDSPVNSVAHARSLVAIEQAARDLIATILDVDEDTFDLEVEYVLPDHIETLVFEAIGARTWLDAAQQLWEQHSVAAIESLLGHGFTARETARLLGLPDEGLDQLLDGTSRRAA